MITDSEYRQIGVGVLRVAIVTFAIGVLTGYLFFN